ncbi:MAG: hypothetical protein NVS3B10_18980 [Polyangiales bacterium]
MRGPLPFALLVVAVVAFGSCKPKAGGTCEADACGDEHTLLACKHGRLLPVSCDGPKGCAVDGATPRCDFSANKPGSECDERFTGKRMCRDAKTALACKNGHFVATTCAGPGGCVAMGDAEALVKDCDTSVGKEGDACDRNFTKKPACDAGGKDLLECGKADTFVSFERCRGPKGCTSQGGEAVCDHSVQQVGDPCTPPVPEVCSADGAMILLCDGHAMFEKPCVGAHGCTLDAKGAAQCDLLAPFVGSPCDKKGQNACQKPGEDDKGHAKLLECDGKKFTLSKKCPGECAFTRPSTYACK